MREKLKNHTCSGRCYLCTETGVNRYGTKETPKNNISIAILTLSSFIRLPPKRKAPIATHPKADLSLIQEKTHLSPRTIQYKLKNLIDQGFIRKEISLLDTRRKYYQLEDE